MSSQGVEAILNYLEISEAIGTAGQPTADQFSAIKAAGYELVVNLAMPDSTNALANEPELVAAQEIDYVHIPVIWEHPTIENLARFFAVMDQNSDRRVFVHCALNMRASVFVQLYRVIHQGVPEEAAREAMVRIWQPDATWQQFIVDAQAYYGVGPIDREDKVVVDDMGKGQTAFLVGKRLYLRPVEREDAVHIRKWANDPQIRALTGEVAPMTQAGFDEFLHKVHHDSDRVWFIVVLKQDGRAIGETGLLRMFPPWRTTDLSIILGEPNAWGQGYGTEAIRLLLDYAFGDLNFHRVAIGVVAFNERALRFYERVGFRREGVQRDGYYHQGQYHDFVMMSILEEEYR